MTNKPKEEKITFTIKEVVKAWNKFNNPKYYVKNNADVDIIALEEGIISVDDVESVEVIQPDYSKWIEYLIMEEWKDDKQN